MSIQVNDFRWEPGKNDAEYIKLLKSSRDEWQKIAQKAIAKLKALSKLQVPRVMTLEEAKDAYVVEYRPGKMREVGSALLDFKVDPLNAEYRKIYRVWTSRPDEKRRAETPWDS